MEDRSTIVAWGEEQWAKGPFLIEINFAKGENNINAT